MALPSDAREAHQRVSRHAVSLSALSASLATESLAVADAYARALAGSTLGAWVSFVAAAAVVARHSASVGTVVALTPRERDAADFFAQIVRENDDLLTTDADSAAVRLYWPGTAYDGRGADRPRNSEQTAAVYS
jgi:hypothetical protein